MITIRRAKIEDLPALTDIYNYEVLNGTATFDITPKTVEERLPWFNEHSGDVCPLFVAVNENQTVAGYVSLSPYRSKDAYKTTAELSVYVDKEFRQQGIGCKMMDFIIDYARKQGSLHNIISVISGENAASKKMHDKFGFVLCGIIPDVAQKFDRYLSIANYVLLI